MLSAYCLVGAMWALFAGTMHRYKNGYKNIVLTVIANFLFWPIAIPYAFFFDRKEDEG